MAIGLSKAEVSQQVKKYQANKEAIKAHKEKNKAVYDEEKRLEKECGEIKDVLFVSTQNGEKAVYFEDLNQTVYFSQTPKAFVENRLNIVDGKTTKPGAELDKKTKAVIKKALPTYQTKKGAKVKA